MIMYDIYTALLVAIGMFTDAFSLLAGIRPIQFNGEPMMIHDLFLTASPVSVAFWGITLIGVALALFFSVMLVTQKAADLNVEKTMGMVLGHIGKSMLMFLITPLMVIMVLQIITLSMRQTDELFDIAHGSYSMETVLFALTAREAAIDDFTVVDRFASGELNFRNTRHVTEHLVVSDINFWVGIPLAFLMMIIYMFILVILVYRLFMMIILYVVSPLFVASMVIDDGAKYRGWRSAFFARMLSGFSLIIAMNVIAYLVMPFLMSEIALSQSLAADVTLKFLFVVGCVYAAYHASGLLTKIIAPESDDDSGMIMGMVAGFAMKRLNKLTNAVKGILPSGGKN